MALPGLGHLYLGRWTLGAIEMALGLALFAAGLARLTGAFVRMLREGTDPFSLLRVCLPWALILACYSVADGLFTLLVSRHRLVVTHRQR